MTYKTCDPNCLYLRLEARMKHCERFTTVIDVIMLVWRIAVVMSVLNHYHPKPRPNSYPSRLFSITLCIHYVHRLFLFYYVQPQLLLAKSCGMCPAARVIWWEYDITSRVTKVSQHVRALVCFLWHVSKSSSCRILSYSVDVLLWMLMCSLRELTGFVRIFLLKLFTQIRNHPKNIMYKYNLIMTTPHRIL